MDEDNIVVRQEDFGGRRMMGRPVNSFLFESRNGQPFSTEIISAWIREVAAVNPDLEFKITTHTAKSRWKSVKGWATGGAAIRYVENPANYDEIEIVEDDDGGQIFEITGAFVMVAPRQNPAGGCKPGSHDGMFDCLIRSLNRVMAGRVNGLADEELRRVAGVGPGVPIPATHEVFAHIQGRLGGSVRLEISGDVSWTSPDPKPMVARIRLHKQHFEPRRDPKRAGFQGTAVARKETPKQAAFLETADCVLLLVEGEDEPREISREQLDEWCRKPMSAPYGLVRCCTSDADPLAMLRAALAKNAETRAVLLPLGIDYFKVGASLKKFALELFRRNSIAIPAPEPLSPLEEDYISGNGWRYAGEAALRGGLVYTCASKDKPWRGRAVAFDFRSFYPAIMSSGLTLPNCRGVETYVARFDPEKPSRGLYRASVSVPEAMRPLWNHADDREQYWTHIDLKRAAKLGGEIRMAPGPVNAILYSEGRMAVRAEDVFGAYVRLVWELRQKNNHPAVKTILNILCGALCQQRKIYSPLSEAPQDLPRIEKMGRYADGRVWLCWGGEPGNRFVGEFPRFAPFLTAQARLRATEAILEATRGDLSKLVRVHTDGFVIAGRLEDMPEATKKRIGPGLGELKVEATGIATVSGLRKPRWE